MYDNLLNMVFFISAGMVLALWLWGVIVISTGRIEDGNGCWLT